MKLAIASTTLLFAMMAAQAAVLSTTSSTDVNLVKRAPTSDDEADVEQSDMAEALKDSIEELKRRREGKTPAERTRINASIAEFEKELAELEYRFREMMTKREPQANVYRELKKAVYEGQL
ncbi:hypothetical protein BASA61_007534 [Batrachochytrium salamandrivorans]|nr:hypothetical protein BASA61_007534 [Batrachochytrium salamandrivorans]